MNPHRLERPANVDQPSWNLAAELDQQNCYQARRGLMALAKGGLPTDLDAELVPAGLACVRRAELAGLRRLWEVALTRGLRTTGVPPRWTRVRKVLREIGIDEKTVAFLRLKRKALGSYYETAWWYLGQLRDHGLPTCLDADLEEGPTHAFVVSTLRQGVAGLLAEMPVQQKHFSVFRGTLRTVYRTALTCGLRQRPIPAFLTYTRPRTNTAELWAQLSDADRGRLERLFAELERLTARQQAGQTRRIGKRKDTAAQTTVRNYRTQVVNSILRHALAGGWPLQVDSLFRPDPLTAWVYRGRHSDGLPLSEKEPRLRLALLHGLLERSVDVSEPLVALESLPALFAHLEGYRGEVNVRKRSRDEDEEEPRFTPTIAQILDAIAKVEEDFARATLRYERGQLSLIAYHKEYQERTFFWCELLGAWRKDTATTIDLALAKRDPETGVILVRGVRAKQSRRDGKYYVTVIILPQAADKIEEFLRFEGRSVDHPLREGETPLRLRAERRERQGDQSVVVQAGDRWGHDVLKNDDEFVVPLWRKRADSPEPLSYLQVDLMQRRILHRIGWPEAIPHSLRVMGALYLRSRGFQLDQIMEIGLWKSLETLLKCYARLNLTDRLSEMAALAPSATRGTPATERRRRDAAILRIQRAAVDVHGDPTLTAHEHFEKELRAAADEIARANAAERGKDWRPSEVSEITHKELVLLDEALRPLYKDGASEVLERAVLASARIQQRRARTKVAPPTDHAELLERLANLPPDDRGGRGGSDFA